MHSDIIRGHIASAYMEISGTEEGGVFISLADLRRECPAVTRADLDRELAAMYRAQHINLVPQDNWATMTGQDRAAALRLGGEDKHRVSYRG